MNAKQCLATVMILAAAATWGQHPAPAGPHGRPEAGDRPAMPPDNRPGAPQHPGPNAGDPIADSFFPPELVMQNQGVLGLSDQQKTAIKETMRKSVAEFTDLQWQQSAEAEAMAALVKPERVDEAKVLAQLDKLLDIEKQVKRLHLSTMIQIKNVLTPEQHAKLRQLRQPAGPGRGQPPGGAR